MADEQERTDNFSDDAPRPDGAASPKSKPNPPAKQVPHDAPPAYDDSEPEVIDEIESPASPRDQEMERRKQAVTRRAQERAQARRGEHPAQDGREMPHLEAPSMAGMAGQSDSREIVRVIQEQTAILERIASILGA